jgi:hypothetical protein
MIAPAPSLQPRYSLLHREVETEILPHCRERRDRVIVYSPMASGLLTGAMNRDRIASLPKDDWRKGHSDFNEPNLSCHLALVDHLKEIARRRGGSAGEVALASDNAESCGDRGYRRRTQRSPGGRRNARWRTALDRQGSPQDRALRQHGEGGLNDRLQNS